jgi:hypothetical protein
MKQNSRQAAVSFVVTLVAIMYGAAQAAGFFLGIFYFPLLFTTSDFLLLWGWIGTPLGLIFGAIAFVKGASSAESFLRKRLLSAQ